MRVFYCIPLVTYSKSKWDIRGLESLKYPDFVLYLLLELEEMYGVKKKYTDIEHDTDFNTLMILIF